MATNTRIGIAEALLMCDALVDRLDVGAGTAKVEIRSGTQPANPDTAPSDGLLLASIDLPNPAFDDAIDDTPNALASLLGVPLSDPAANNTGTATWFRAYNRNGDAVIDGTVGLSDADMIIDNTSVVEDQQVNINSWDVVVPQ